MLTASDVSVRRLAVGSVPVVRGVVAGQVAWAVGLLAAAVAVAAADHAAVVAATLGETAPSPAFSRLVGWVQFNAHTVDVVVTPATQGGTPSPVRVSVLADGFSPLLYTVPVAALVVAGALVTVLADRRGLRPGLVAGLAVVPGYFVASVASRLAATTAWSMGPGGTAAPAAAGALVVSGLLYPVVCAGLGGALAGGVRAAVATRR